MTEQEAIKRLEFLNDALNFNRADSDESSCALQMGIEALEKQIAKKPIHIRKEYDKHNWRKDENGKIDLFAWENGFCNGPICEQCGETPCANCDPDYDDEKCVNEYHICPECGKRVTKTFSKNYCQCGQRLEWEAE